MRKRAFITATMALATGLFIFTSCDNGSTNEGLSMTTADVESAEDDLMVEDIFNSIDSEIDNEVANLDAAEYETSSFKSTDENELYVCKTVTVDHPDTTHFPKIITIDYGEGCSSVIKGDTITRKGKIVITVSDRWFKIGATRTATFDNYYVNDVKIEGKRITENKGLNEEGHMEFDITLEDGKVIFNDTLEYTREANKTREWYRAPNPIDDVWYISGSCEGVNLDGENYSHEITRKLVIVRCEEFRYSWITTEGVVALTKGDKEATVDYGEGTCDDTALLTFNGETKEIKVRNRYFKMRRSFRKTGK